jgi:hypothetical protein
MPLFQSGGPGSKPGRRTIPFALDLVGEDAALIRPPGRIVTGTSDQPGLVQQPERPFVEREIAGQHRGSGPIRECSVKVARRSPKPSVMVRIRALPPTSIWISRCHRVRDRAARGQEHSVSRREAARSEADGVADDDMRLKIAVACDNLATCSSDWDTRSIGCAASWPRLSWSSELSLGLTVFLRPRTAWLSCWFSLRPQRSCGGSDALADMFCRATNHSLQRLHY